MRKFIVLCLLLILPVAVAYADTPLSVLERIERIHLTPWEVDLDPTLLDFTEAEVGDHITLGAYEQDNNPQNGREPIEWRVLAKEDNRILVISEYALDSVRYKRLQRNTSWKDCDLRQWLNHDFMEAAFNKHEKALIPIVTLSNEKNAKYKTSAGSDTQDRIFALSAKEAKRYFASDRERICYPTAYALAQGVHGREGGEPALLGQCWWWLRTPGVDQNRAVVVYYGGHINAAGNGVHRDNPGVRPAMWVQLIHCDKRTP